MLAQLARDQRLAIGTLQEGDGFQFMPFLGDIGEQGKMAIFLAPQVLGKAAEILLVIFKDVLGQQFALSPGVGREAMRIEIEQAAISHVFILLMMS